MNIVSKTARKEIVEALRARYGKAPKLEKGLILGEFTSVSGYHRKHAIRLLSSMMKVPMQTVMASRRVYDEAVKTALTILWEAADRICGKRLKPAIPNLIRAMEKHGHLQLDPTVRKLVLAVRAATIDRLLTPVRKSREPNAAKGRWRVFGSREGDDGGGKCDGSGAVIDVFGCFSVMAGLLTAFWRVRIALWANFTTL
jgi:hypothetical protein